MAMTKIRLVNLEIILSLPCLFAIPAIGHKTEEKVTAYSALAELKAGNAHHVQHRYQHPHQTADRQRQLGTRELEQLKIWACGF
jgi:hypothetical protein